MMVWHRGPMETMGSHIYWQTAWMGKSSGAMCVLLRVIHTQCSCFYPTFPSKYHSTYAKAPGSITSYCTHHLHCSMVLVFVISQSWQTAFIKLELNSELWSEWFHGHSTNVINVTTKMSWLLQSEWWLKSVTQLFWCESLTCFQECKQLSRNQDSPLLWPVAFIHDIHHHCLLSFR